MESPVWALQSCPSRRRRRLDVRVQRLRLQPGWRDRRPALCLSRKSRPSWRERRTVVLVRTLTWLPGMRERRSANRSPPGDVSLQVGQQRVIPAWRERRLGVRRLRVSLKGPRRQSRRAAVTLHRGLLRLCSREVAPGDREVTPPYRPHRAELRAPQELRAREIRCRTPRALPEQPRGSGQLPVSLTRTLARSARRFPSQWLAQSRSSQGASPT